jgi:hypothetical protein
MMASSSEDFASNLGKLVKSFTDPEKVLFLLLKRATNAKLGSAQTRMKCTNFVTARASEWVAGMTQDASPCTSGTTFTEAAVTTLLALKMNSYRVKLSFSA